MRASLDNLLRGCWVDSGRGTRTMAANLCETRGVHQVKEATNLAFCPLVALVVVWLCAKPFDPSICCAVGRSARSSNKTSQCHGDRHKNRTATHYVPLDWTNWSARVRKALVMASYLLPRPKHLDEIPQSCPGRYCRPIHAAKLWLEPSFNLTISHAVGTFCHSVKPFPFVFPHSYWDYPVAR